MVPNRVALVGLLTGLAGVGGCTTVRRVQAAEYFADNSPEVVWVTYTNDTVVAVAEPVIRRDTLRGMWPGTRDRVKIPLGEIRSVQARVPDHTRTAILVASLGVVTVSTLYFGVISKTGPGVAGGIECGVDRKGDVIQDC